MYRGKNTRIFPIILIIIIVALVITAIVSAIQALVGGNKTQQPAVDPAITALHNTSETAKVQMTVRGPLVANENFRSYQIVITPTTRTITTYSGYLDQVLETRQYDNNVKAYEEFVYALDKANYLKNRKLDEDKNDTRGICSGGRVYEFDTIDGNQNIAHYWTSTCKGSPGSFMASVQQVGGLFMNQIPDAKTTISNAKL